MEFFFDFSLFIGFALALVLIVYLLAFLLSFSKLYNTTFEKISPYECGFNPFDDSRHQFDISFYLIGILFIIFDLEVSFLFPWVLSLNFINLFGYFVMIIFLIVLTIGFIYEWYNGVLDFS